MELFTLTGALIACLLFLFAWGMWKRHVNLKAFQKLGLPGPRPTFLLGNGHQLGKLGFRETIHEWTKQYGKCYGVFFDRPTIIVSDPELLREVMVKKFASFPNRIRNNFMDHKPWSNSLIQLRNDHWRHVRNQLSPTFSSGKLKKMMPAIDRMLLNLDNYIREKAHSGEEVELKYVAGCFTMDTIAGAAFGIHVDSLSNPQDPFNVNGLAIMKQNTWALTLHTMLPCLSPLLNYLGLTFIPTPPTQFFVKIMEAALNDRRKDQKSYTDFIQMLVDAERQGGAKGPVDAEIDHSADLTTSGHWNQKGLNDEEMKANALLFFVAGFETTSVALSFTLFDLAANPLALKKAQDEVDQKLGKNRVSYTTAADLPYLDMCLNESMRLNPPGFLVDRQAMEDTELGGYPVKKGYKVMIPIYSVHRDPDHWPQPEQFRPERHSPDAKASRHPFSFLPFGQGPRNCIGMRLAQLQVRMALATVLQHYTPVLCNKSVYPPRLVSEPRMLSKDGLWVKFQLRE